MSRRRDIRKKRRKKDKTTTKSETLKNIDQLRVQVKKQVKEETKEVDKFNRNLMASVLIIVVLSMGIGAVILSTPNDNMTSTADITVNEEGKTSNLVFQTLNGDKFDLITYKGSHIIIDVMGTTCQPCLQQVVILKTFVEEYPQVKVVSASSDSIQMIRSFQETHSCSWLHLHDAYGVSRNLKIQYIPTLIHLNPSFNEDHRNMGVTDLSTLATWVS